MGMEKHNYRETLVYLRECFDGKMLLNKTEVAKEFKVSTRTIEKRYPFTNNLIELTKLASAMCLSKEEIRKLGFYL